MSKDRDSGSQNGALIYTLSGVFGCVIAFQIVDTTEDKVSEPYPGQILSSRYDEHLGRLHTLYDENRQQICHMGSVVTAQELLNPAHYGDCKAYADMTQAEQAQKTHAITLLRR